MTKYWPMDKAMEAVDAVVLREQLASMPEAHRARWIDLSFIEQPTVKRCAVQRLQAASIKTYDNERVYINNRIWYCGNTVEWLVKEARLILRAWEREGLL